MSIPLRCSNASRAGESQRGIHTREIHRGMRLAIFGSMATYRLSKFEIQEHTVPCYQMHWHRLWRYSITTSAALSMCKQDIYPHEP